VTCVVGVRSKSGVLLAADSQFTTDSGNGALRMANDSKTYALSELVAIAYCGSGRLGQILTYHLRELDEPPVAMDEHEWAVRYFVDELRGALDAHGHLHTHRGVETLGWSAFLLAVRGRLFSVWEDFDVLEHAFPFDALGSGAEVAMGAMSSLVVAADRRRPMADAKAEEVASAGIAAAAEHTGYVGGKVTSVSTVCWTADERVLARRILKQ